MFFLPNLTSAIHQSSKTSITRGIKPPVGSAGRMFDQSRFDLHAGRPAFGRLTRKIPKRGGKGSDPVNEIIMMVATPALETIGPHRDVQLPRVGFETHVGEVEVEVLRGLDGGFVPSSAIFHDREQNTYVPKSLPRRPSPPQRGARSMTRTTGRHPSLDLARPPEAAGAHFQASRLYPRTS